MTTMPQTDTHLTFSGIDAHVRAQAATAPPQTQQSPTGQLLARYATIRPILAALAAIPLIPANWRAGIAAFLTTADEVALLVETPATTEPAPLPITQPDFKAGKDQ